jgi:SAM-dependent methyltransferase
MLSVGSPDAEDFAATGTKLVGRLRRNAGLGPGDVVLDLGCGFGRVARPLTALLEPRPDGRASYVGVDISADAVRWCSSTITPRYPGFLFRRIDARNGMYNPDGVIPPDEVRLAEPDDFFDRAVVSSVFTHVDADTVERYLIELHRVLRPGGRALVTFFLVTPQAAADTAALLRFPLHRHDDRSWVRDPERPEVIWAHDADHVLGCLSDLGFELGKHSVAKWANLSKRSPGQDLLVITKPDAAPGPGPEHGTAVP